MAEAFTDSQRRSLDIWAGRPVSVSEYAVETGPARAVYRRSLVARLLAGRTMDATEDEIPAVYELAGFGFVIHPKLWATECT